jgi:outer membrane beta-barrel protein
MALMNTFHTLVVAVGSGLAATVLSVPALAQTQNEKPADDQVVVPQVERREIKPPRYPSNDFEVGAFIGTYATQNFGSSLVYGVRLGYAITEDFFVQGAYGSTQVSDENFRQILPGGVFPTSSERLSYYNLSVGYNVLPGEVFVGANRALPSAMYLIAGVGSTDFAGQSRQTFNVGFGARVFLKDSFAVQVDVRDHIFSLDVLGQSQSTQNLELTVGFGFFF